MLEDSPPLEMSFPTAAVLTFILYTLIVFPVLDARCSLDHCLNCTHGPCTRCSNGWYGVDCSRRCVACQSDGCEQFIGRCIHCSPGFYGDLCDIPCPVNCLETFTGATFCNRTTGRCLEGCRESFWGSRCDTDCSQNCLQSGCEQRNGGCLYGCIDGFYGRYCVQHCPKNCQKCSYLYGNCDSCKHGFYGSQCNTSCEQCKYEECRYNELDETVVCVNGCKDGWTSNNCTVRCSERCKDQLCEKEGRCTACPGGYFGDDCTLSDRTPTTRRISDVEDNLATVSKYVSHACRSDSHRWYGYLPFALIVNTLLY